MDLGCQESELDKVSRHRTITLRVLALDLCHVHGFFLQDFDGSFQPLGFWRCECVTSLSLICAGEVPGRLTQERPLFLSSWGPTCFGPNFR